MERTVPYLRTVPYCHPCCCVPQCNSGYRSCVGKCPCFVFSVLVDADMKGKWINVASLVPMHKIDSDQLRYWCNTVMKSLKDMFFILAVSVYNHRLYATGENVRKCSYEISLFSNFHVKTKNCMCK